MAGNPPMSMVSAWALLVLTHAGRGADRHNRHVPRPLDPLRRWQNEHQASQTQGDMMTAVPAHQRRGDDTRGPVTERSGCQR